MVVAVWHQAIIWTNAGLSNLSEAKLKEHIREK